MRAEKPNLESILSLIEFEPLAQGCMSEMVFGYVAGGAADELTLSSNCDDWKRIRLAPRAVLVGRPYLYALAFAGAAGVARVIEILRTELMMAMALTGRASIAEIDRTVLWDQQ